MNNLSRTGHPASLYPYLCLSSLWYEYSRTGHKSIRSSNKKKKRSQRAPVETTFCETVFLLPRLVQLDTVARKRERNILNLPFPPQAAAAGGRVVVNEYCAFFHVIAAMPGRH